MPIMMTLKPKASAMVIIDKLLSCMKLSKYIIGFIIMSGLLCLVPFVYAQEAQEQETEVSTAVYTDVDIGHPEYVALKYLSENNIINGYEDGSFKPDTLVNRAEALKMILEAQNLITAHYITNHSLGGASFNENPLTFTDIYKSVWYYPYIKKGVELGIVKGYEDGTFKPDQTVNRVESFKMIMESDDIVLPEVTENPFADVDMNTWFAPYLLEAKLREIIYYTMNNTVNPNKEMTRSRFAELVYRYIRSKEGHCFGKASYYSDYLEGRSTSTGEPYRASELTAAHLTLPFGTIVRVTNLANGQSVDVRINDRGPYITGRSIDLSKSAFDSIAHLGSGIIWIEYEIIKQP
ncbi:septal ring lytic transglycosylase RlpA family protein [Candidatus Peregrinibacteria bacterium]|nr:septal ring lytic transglycosylase RlpA family protein [Candidatus Peregrinibacteria bacterium]